MKSMRLIGKFLIGLEILLLAACSNPPQSTNPESSPAPTTSASPTQSVDNQETGEHPTSSQGGQVIESGVYHLELVSLLERDGIHLDFFLQKGDNHEAIPDASVMAQVQLPDGEQKTLEMKYDIEGKHYAAFLPTQAAGEYKVAVQTDINGEKVNGRFSFSK
jgi:hypothetical protein